MLPTMATYGLQIVSPCGGCSAVAGIDDPGPGAMVGAVITGNGGGPAERTGADAGGVDGNGGGVSRGDSVAFDSGDAAFSLAGAAGVELGVLEVAVAAGAAARNSEIGCQEDFASFQARSPALKLPSATLVRMSDSEKRPANCPFR